MLKVSTLALSITVTICVIASDFAAGAGTQSAPAISNASVDVTGGGTLSCHINDANDKVFMTASAEDYDPCNAAVSGNRINLSATQWSIGSGVLNGTTGSTNNWKAGTATGQYTLTVTFHDLDDGADYDDDGKEVQKTLTAFRVGVNLSTSGGSSLTKWENSTGGGIGFAVPLSFQEGLTTPSNSPKTAAESSTATWALRVEPDSTPIKGDIRAWAHAGSINPTNGNPSRIEGSATDSDFDVGGGGSASFSIGLSLGVVSFSYSQDLSGDDNTGVASVGAGFDSQVHANYSEKIEMVSDTNPGAEQKTIGHTPADAAITGKPGLSKQAEWEIGCKLQVKLSAGNTAGGGGEGNMECIWTITDTLPSYLAAAP